MANKSTLHVILGDDTGDIKSLERAARDKALTPIWTAPKSAQVGDEVVVYIRGHGFYATGKIATPARPRSTWHRRWGSRLGSLKLISPAISISIIEKRVPELPWARYPRSITTPSPGAANAIRKLVKRRRADGAADIDEDEIDETSFQELWALAIASSKSSLHPKLRLVRMRDRARVIHKCVLKRAGGYCEGCGGDAPFLRGDGTPYLEPHHITQVADDGPDHPAHVVAVCPTCHSRAHHSRDRLKFNRTLKKQLAVIVRKLKREKRI